MVAASVRSAGAGTQLCRLTRYATRWFVSLNLARATQPVVVRIPAPATRRKSASTAPRAVLAGPALPPLALAPLGFARCRPFMLTLAISLVAFSPPRLWKPLTPTHVREHISYLCARQQKNDRRCNIATLPDRRHASRRGGRGAATGAVGWQPHKGLLALLASSARSSWNRPAQAAANADAAAGGGAQASARGAGRDLRA